MLFCFAIAASFCGFHFLAVELDVLMRKTQREIHHTFLRYRSCWIEFCGDLSCFLFLIEMYLKLLT